MILCAAKGGAERKFWPYGHSGRRVYGWGRGPPREVATLTTERIPGCARGDDRKSRLCGANPSERALIAGGPAERTGPRAPIRATSPCPARPSRLGIVSFRVRSDRERSRTNKRRAMLSALCAPSNTSSFCGDAGRAEGEALLSIAFAAGSRSLLARAAPTQRAVARRCCACLVWQLMCENSV